MISLISCCHLVRNLYLVLILFQISINDRTVAYDDYSEEKSVTNFSLKPLTSEEKKANEAILKALLKPHAVSARNAGCESNCMTCLASCNYIKQAKQASDAPLVQYLYLAVCAKGCKSQIPCLTDKYCLPVMQENPDYFIQCANSCPLFPIIPKIFVK